MAFLRINEFVAAEGKADDMYAFLSSLALYIKGSTGCLGCDVARHQDDATKTVVIERWQRQEDHKASVDAYPQDKMMQAMPLFAAPPTGNWFVMD